MKELQYILQTLLVCLSFKEKTVTQSASAARCRLHVASNSDTVLQDLERCAPLPAGCVILQGSITGAWAGQDLRTPDPRQKYCAVSNKPKYVASH